MEGLIRDVVLGNCNACGCQTDYRCGHRYVCSYCYKKATSAIAPDSCVMCGRPTNGRYMAYGKTLCGPRCQSDAFNATYMPGYYVKNTVNADQPTIKITLGPPPGMPDITRQQLNESRQDDARERGLRDAFAMQHVADEAFRFMAGLNLQDHPISEQRQYLDVMRKLKKVLKP